MTQWFGYSYLSNRSLIGSVPSDIPCLLWVITEKLMPAINTAADAPLVRGWRTRLTMLFTSLLNILFEWDGRNSFTPERDSFLLINRGFCGKSRTKRFSIVSIVKVVHYSSKPSLSKSPTFSSWIFSNPALNCDRGISFSSRDFSLSLSTSPPRNITSRKHLAKCFHF